MCGVKNFGGWVGKDLARVVKEKNKRVMNSQGAAMDDQAMKEAYEHAFFAKARSLGFVPSDGVSDCRIIDLLPFPPTMSDDEKIAALIDAAMKAISKPLAGYEE
jgi:hypothetical protein